MRKVLALTILSAVCALFLNIGVFAAESPDFTPEEQEFISSCGTLKVGFVPDRIPVSFADENGNLAGISYYIFQRISELSGLQFEYAALPTKNVTYDYLNSEGFDLVTSVEFNEENKHARGILISRPYLSSKKVVVARDKLDFRYDGNFSVAVATGSQTLKKVLERIFPNFTILDYDTIEECLDAVNTSKADLMIQNQYVVEYWLSKPKYENLKVIPVVGLDDELCYSAVVEFGDNSEKSQRDGEILINILDKTIACLSDDEVVNCTIQGVMENQYNYNLEDFLSRYRYSVIIFCVAAVSIVIFVIILARQKIRIAQSRADAKAKGEFLSTMSHEIKTPINGMIGLNRLMSEKLDNPEKLEVYLRQSTVTAKYLLSLVNDVLDSSRLQANNIRLDKQPVDLSLLTETVVTAAKGTMRDRKIEFSARVDISEPYIIGDSVRIQQVLFNLLDNAGKFTPAGGKVSLSLEQEPCRNDVLNTFKVSDNGKGMSEEFLAKLFDAFTRELDGVSKGNQGTGLGLSISRRLARLMDGDVTCISKKGEGSEFTFTFRAAKTCAPLPHGRKNDPNKAKPRVLVVEDNELNAEIMTELLRREGYPSELATNGKQAVEMFSQSEVNAYGIILMDLMMPELDGYGATRAIRALNRTDAKTVRIIACTANSFNGEYEKSIRCGMDDFITKPVDMDELLQKINK